MRAALDELIASDALAVAFQPIVDLATGSVEGYEVLGRCRHVAGPLGAAASSPSRLLEIAYACGRLLALDRRWRELAFAAIAAHDDGRAAFFINVDPRVAHDADFAPGFTQGLARRHRVAAHRIVLELTETIEAPEAIEHVLRHYAAQGFRVAVDDLGAGAQSLALLLRLRPQFIKLDGSIVRGAPTDPARAALVRALAGFAEETGARLVAEGIETESVLEAVVGAGAHCGQGFLLGRPAAAPMPLAAASRHALVRAGRPNRGADHDAASMGPLPVLLRLVEGLHERSALDAALGHVTACTRELLGVERVSLRLLDESRARLLVAARSGPSVHHDQRVEFRIGEGLVGWVVANAMPLRLGHAEADPRFAQKPGQVAEVGSFIGVPLLDAHGCIGVLSTASPVAGRFSSTDEAHLRLVAGIVSPHLQIGRLERLAKTDPLTCVLNRHALDEVLPDPDLTQATMSVAMFDIDHFKRLNDRLGHGAGDEALRAVAAALTSSLRANDHVLRIGGEEFLVVLPGVGADAARTIAERARERIASVEVLPGERVTASVGVAERRPDQRRDELLQQADDALYRAKALGRNCTVVAGSG